MTGYVVVLRRSRSVVTLAPARRRAVARDRASARSSRRRRRAARAHEPDADARRRGDVRRVPRRDGGRVADRRSSTRCSHDNSEPFGLLLARRRDVRRRRARRPPRRVAAGQDRGAGARGEPARRCSASRCSTSACRSTCSTPTSSCCRPTSRRSSPCSWVVLLANAINLIDGLDGLAAGIVAHRRRARCSCSPTGCSRPGCLDGSNIAPLVAIIAVGVCVGLPAVQLQPGADHHGRRRRAVPRAAAGGRRRSRSAAAPTDPFSGQTYFFFAPLLIPLVILGVPILDTAFSFVRRLVAAASRSRRPTRTTCTTG